MIWTQTWAVLVDAYRDLNSRKMFWVVLILSALVMMGFATLGVNERGLKFLWWQFPGDIGGPEGARLFYKGIFSWLVIGFYLTWAATILALISTSGIFPDFMTGGAIDLYLSKPIGRWRLFFTKYVSGLLFVALQVAVFALVSFVVLGMRGGTWEPSLFLAIPIVVVFFSYLYGICVLFGVMTRSTIAALLLTILAWFFIWGVDQVDKGLTSALKFAPRQKAFAKRQLERVDRQIAAKEGMATTRETEEDAATSGPATARDQELERLKSERAMWVRQSEAEGPPAWLGNVQKTVVAVKTFVPKTRETTALLDRFLLPDWEIAKAAAKGEEERGEPEMELAQMDPTRGRSVWWIVGSSLMFEVFCVGLAGWVFVRRDY